MKLEKGYIKIFAYVLILLVSIQLFRLEIIFNTDTIKNIPGNVEINDFIKKNFLVIYNEKNQELTNIVYTLDYLNVDYDLVKSSETNKSYLNYKGIIIIEHDLNNIVDIDNLIIHIYDGGRLLYLVDNVIQELDQVNKYSDTVFGIINIGETQETNKVVFNSEILSGLYGELNLDKFNDKKNSEFKFLELDVSNDSYIHMESTNGMPLIWSREYNQGEIIALNIGNYEGEKSQDILIGAIELLGELIDK